MKRELLTVLIGASLVMATDAAAQRARNRGGERERERGGRVEKLEPVRAPGRVIARPVYRTPPVDRRTRVVYSSGMRRPVIGRAHIWLRTDWGRFRVSFARMPHGRAFLNQGELRRLIGPDTLERIRASGRHAGLRGSLRGHWEVEPRRGDVLVVTMEGFDVAELVDFNRDGFVDEVFLIDRREAYGW